MSCLPVTRYCMYSMISKRLRISSTATVHVPNLECIQQLYWRWESSEDFQQDCVLCGKWKPLFWQDPVVDILTYFCETRPWVKKNHSNSTHCQIIRSAFHHEQGCIFKTATRIDNERTKDHVRDCRTYEVY